MRHVIGHPASIECPEPLLVDIPKRTEKLEIVKTKLSLC